jgi:hypothetical protein
MKSGLLCLDLGHGRKYSGMLRYVALLRTEVPEEFVAPIVMIRISKLGTMSALTSNDKECRLIGSDAVWLL